MTMKAWRLDRLGGDLRLENMPMPEVRPGSILVRVEASTLMSYIKPYVEGRLPPYHAPSGGFTPGGNCVGTIETAGRDVWQLAPGQRVLVSSLFGSSENVADPAQILIGVTSFMYPASAYRSVLALVRSGALEISTINPKVFPLTELAAAMDAAASAGRLECVVMKP